MNLKFNSELEEIVEDNLNFDEISQLAEELLKESERQNYYINHLNSLDLELAVLKENIPQDEASSKAFSYVKERLKNTKNTTFLQKYIQRRNKGVDSYKLLENSWEIIYEQLRNNKPENKKNLEFDELGLLTKKCWNEYLNELKQKNLDTEVLRLTTNKNIKQDNYAAFFIDVNGLHGINKDYGEAKGDELISIVADGIRTQFDERQKENNSKYEDRRKQKGYRIESKTTRLITHLENESEQIATRWGGDEFILLLKGDKKDIEQESSQLAQKIIEYLNSNPLRVKGNEKIIPNVGIGYSIRNNLEEAIIDAESACFVAKTAGNHSKSLYLENKNKYNINEREITLVDMYKTLFNHIENATREITTKIYETEKSNNEKNILFNQNQKLNINNILIDLGYEQLNNLLENTNSTTEFMNGLKRSYINSKKDENNNLMVDSYNRARILGRPYIAEETFSKIYNQLNQNIKNLKNSEEETIKIIEKSFYKKIA